MNLRLFEFARALTLLAVWGLPCDIEADDARIPVDARINGRPVHLIFDTGFTHSALFGTTAERLQLKVSATNQAFSLTPGSASLGLTEPCTFVFQTITAKVQFAVIDLPSGVRTDVEGALAWFPFKSNVFTVDAARGRVTLDRAMPNAAKAWPRYDLLPDSQLLGFRIPGPNPDHNQVYVDTGNTGGVKLSPSLWKDWIAARTTAPSTREATYSPATGLTVYTELWAKEITLGPLKLKGVPVQEQVAAYTISLMPNHAATLGMYALRRLNLVVDGVNGVVYAHESDEPAPPYPHNRLGAVFVPVDVHRDGPLLAHVAPGSPAFLAGIRNDDVLLKIGDLDVTKWRSDPQVTPLSRFWERPPGSVLSLTLRRGERDYPAIVVLKNILDPEAGERGN